MVGAARLDAAYRTCERDARAHYENFPVASLLVPRAMRRHVAAIYAFARAADDFADEGDSPVAERRRLLEGWRRRVLQCAGNDGQGWAAQRGEPADSVEIFLALGATIREKQLPVVLFEDLLDAFEQDLTVARYETWSDLLDYCRRSANPVGRLVLRIGDYRDERFDAWSDDICTALQLVNFWQDVESDLARGRVYVPAADMREAGASERDLHERHLSDAWQRALSVVAARTRTLFDRGRPLCDAVGGRLRYELRATWLGGVRILDRLEQSHFDVFTSRPSLGAGDVPALAWQMARWSVGRR